VRDEVVGGINVCGANTSGRVATAAAVVSYPYPGLPISEWVSMRLLCTTAVL
jgi:hypothetical protein